MNTDIRSHTRTHLDRQIEEVRHDPYRERGKPVEPAVCPGCGLAYHGGRWQRATHRSDVNHHTCPACLRTQDKFPAGIVTFSGGYAAEHREALLAKARREESLENAEHPLQRIMATRVEGERTVLETTDPHLARRIGSAIADAFGGQLAVEYPQDEYMVRVAWSRD